MMRTSVSNSSHQQGAPAQVAQRYLSFMLNREEYAVPVLQVAEIIGRQEVTTLPQTPHYVRGVMNLRGRIIPVIDLRVKFGLVEDSANERACIVVVRAQIETELVSVGLQVDAVSEVLSLTEGDIEEMPSLGAAVHLPYLIGLAKSQGRVRVLVDINKLLTHQELEAVAKVASAPAALTH